MTVSETHPRKRVSEDNTITNKRHKISATHQETECPTEDVKLIMPKPVTTSPALFPDRKKHIQTIANIIKRKQPSVKTPNLRATEIEYEIARSTTHVTYASTLRNAILKLQHPEKFQSRNQVKKHSQENQLKLLKSIEVSVAKLRQYGFVMSVPEATPYAKITRNCQRCDTEFKLSQQLESTSCEFHYGRVRRNPDNKTRYYDCCLAPKDDSKPCDIRKHHVYQNLSPEEKQSICPYVKTEDIFDQKGKYSVLGIDCEMGYTTRGFELMRVTAVDYFTLKTVMDTYVLPFGEVVDFNTRFSGISAIDEKFVSFNQMIQELGIVMDKDTILIGHGLENDMNALRLIHSHIIDTSILYPKFESTPTSRKSLKDLTFKYLSRNIQVGDHDSAEDSIAAIEIVKYHVGRMDVQNT
ncbi:Rex3 protein [Candida orthopsilosis Co 90-125]|uniref:RNA exonuclease 3 n=1 Tax=Candida orthopsilosis (strain 90-125) TaxID=1136231 RepID=H8WVV0_CANO9|nr:Rex3 protein [Candida orthopsilosis Co 90-125]CCG20574.1 Rex3 protein [Candida orthopsilosis Co 90-125]